MENPHTNPAKASSQKKLGFLPFKKTNAIAKFFSPNLSSAVEKEAERQDLTRVDKNQRTVLHRAALDQNVSVVRQLCERAQILGLPSYINSTDKFGNTPLLSACVENSSELSSDKLECIQILLEHGADPNKSNNNTRWTPLSWCAFYGEYETVDVLLKKDALPFTVDLLGYFPLDLVGLQDKDGRRRATAKIIIKNLLARIEDFDKRRQVESFMENEFKEKARYLKSPLLRSSLLYWAIHYDLDVDRYVTRIMKIEGVYPDLPLKTNFSRNCYHACCASGNKSALKLLLDTESRYNEHFQRFVQDKNTHISRDEAGVFEVTAEERKEKIFSKEFFAYIKEASSWIIQFEKEIEKMMTKPEEMPKYFEAQDFFGNTPMHTASYLGKVEIVEILLNHNANPKIENKDGWRCLELKQLDAIDELYKKYLLKTSADNLQLLVGMKLLKMKTLGSPPPNESSGQSLLMRSLKGSPAKGVDRSATMSKNVQKLENQKLRESLFNEERYVPDLVIIFKPKLDNIHLAPTTMNRVNFNIGVLNSSFSCYLATDIKGSTCYLLIKMSEEELEEECQEHDIQVKLMNAYEYQTFDISRKEDFEPFRSRQRIEITQAALNNVINVQQLKDTKVIQDIYPMHTVSGMNRIKEVWLNSKWYWPEPLASLKDYFREGRHLNFTAITTMRMYFGEKMSFYFAWTSFYTCYLLVLAIPGLIIFCIIDSDNEKVALPIWVIYNSLCSTLVVEKWKRKAAEIATRWGTLEMLENKVHRKVMRNEFIGNEIINETTGALTKHNKKADTTFYFLLSAPLLILLMAAVVGTFILTQKLLKDNTSLGANLVISVLNGIIIAVLNFAYQKLARYFVDKENHKYTDSYERSLIFKGFLSQFFNSYLGIYYLIFVEDIELYRVSYNLISILITKQATSICTQTLLPWLQYEYKKRNYFKMMNKKGEEQWKLQKQKDDVDAHEPQDPNQKKEEIDYVYNRPVLDCSKGVAETDKWDLTQVELNAMRAVNDDFSDDYGLMLIQYGYITIFASAFPIGPLISFIANIVDTRAKIFSFSKLYHRPPIEKAAGIGDWQYVWELMSIVGVFTNALILFFRSEASAGFFENWLGEIIPGSTIYQDIRRLWVFLIVVYFIFILKLLVRAFIKDKPTWVMEELEKHKAEEKIALEKGIFGGRPEKVDRRDQTTIIQEASSFNHNENLLTARGQDNSALGSAAKKKNSPQKPILQTTPRKDSQGKPQKEFFPKSPRDAASSLNSTANELNLGIKGILFNSFSFIEREFVLKRLAQLSEHLNESVLKCDSCQKAKAMIDCLDCKEKYCQECLKTVHNQTVRKAHKLVNLTKDDLKGSQNGSPVKIPANREQAWVKIENYSFPTFKQGDLYQNLEHAYKILYQIYITGNGISSDNQIVDAKKALKIKSKTDKNNKTPGQEGTNSQKTETLKPTSLLNLSEDLGEIDNSRLEEMKKFLGFTQFNVEEKILMNRIALMIFTRRGAKATYDDFYKQIKILQEGNFETKVILLFDLIDQDGDGIIGTTQLSKFLDLSYIQNLESNLQNEAIIQETFEGQTSVNKKVAINALIKNKKAKLLLQNYFQLKNKDANLLIGV